MPPGEVLRFLTALKWDPLRFTDLCAWAVTVMPTLPRPARAYSRSSARRCSITVSRPRRRTIIHTLREVESDEGAGPMPFQFYCPQGHLLEGHEAQMGQQGQCPMCGAMFMFPMLGGQPGAGMPGPMPGQMPGPMPGQMPGGFPGQPGGFPGQQPGPFPGGGGGPFGGGFPGQQGPGFGEPAYGGGGQAFAAPEPEHRPSRESSASFAPRATSCKRPKTCLAPKRSAPTATRR